MSSLTGDLDVRDKFLGEIFTTSDKDMSMGSMR